MLKMPVTHRGENFRSLLDGGDLRPFPLLKELNPGGVVEGGRRVGTKERGEALAVGERWRTGAVG